MHCPILTTSILVIHTYYLLFLTNYTHFVCLYPCMFKIECNLLFWFQHIKRHNDFFTFRHQKAYEQSQSSVITKKIHHNSACLAQKKLFIPYNLRFTWIQRWIKAYSYLLLELHIFIHIVAHLLAL